MGVVLGVETDNTKPATEGDALEAVAIEEDLKIEEITRSPTESMQS
jgi:hypothetical protein